MCYLLFRQLLEEQDGQDLVEYSLLLAFIALGTVAILSGTSTSVKDMFSKIASTLGSAVTAAS
jgi:Flp pilus assembly pilin Flp